MKWFSAILLLAVLSYADGFAIDADGEPGEVGDPVAPAAPMVKRLMLDREEEEEEDEEDEERRQSVLHEIKDILQYAAKRHLSDDVSKELRNVNPLDGSKLGVAFKHLFKELDIGKRRQKVGTQCKKPYPQTSTMCAYPDDPYAKDKGVSDRDRQVILDEHNKYRANVNPPAKNMQKMYWCPELEALAQKWAQVCSSQFHDQGKQREVPGWNIIVGQNAAYGQPDWATVVAQWHAEVEDFRYGASYGSDWGRIGHYTQVVQENATCVGCGFAKCNKGPNYICNYAFGNPFLNRIGYPYEQGTPCSGCPGKCSNNLCDCQGLVCKNGGFLDPESCTCICKGKLWTGKDCTQQNKAECKDNEYCDKPYGFLGKCKIWTNVPEECPQMCGVC